MGAWGHGAFENDDAGDWIHDLLESEGLTLLASSLEVPADDSYLEAPVGSVIVCAAEVLAALRGFPSEALPEDLATWVGHHKKDAWQALLPRASARLDRVLAERSELRELWEENASEYPAWRDSVMDVKRRLNVSK
jgi:hypothetical protein